MNQQCFILTTTKKPRLAKHINIRFYIVKEKI
jgi:hypothetical protein